MIPNDLLDDIIARIDPEFIPAEYIIMARYIDRSGVEKIVRGLELERFLLDRTDAHSARVVLDTRKIKKAIIAAVTSTMEMSDRMFRESDTDQPN
jgi:hypothetical protein